MDDDDDNELDAPPEAANYRRSVARRTAVSAEVAERLPAGAWKPPCYAKSVEERRQLSEIIRTSTDGRLRTVFASVPEDVFEKVLDATFSKQVAKNEHILRQGDTGDYFYIVKAGKFAIYVDSIKVFEAGLGMAFGELALLYNAPRLATIVALEDSECWCLERAAFRNLVVLGAGRAFAQTVEFLQKCDIFQELSDEQIAALAEVVQEEEFENDEAILLQGEKDDNMYIMRTGEAVACIDGPEGELEVMLYKTGNYFGEIALLLGEPRKASVYAKGPCTCMYISRPTFQRVLGSLAEFLQKNIGKYEKYHDALRAASEHTEEQWVDLSTTTNSFGGSMEVYEGGVQSQVRCTRAKRRVRTEKAPDVASHKVEKELRSEGEPLSLEEKVRSDFNNPELVTPAPQFKLPHSEIQAFGGLRLGEKFKCDKVAVVDRGAGPTVTSDGSEDEYRWNELTVHKGSTHMALVCQKGQKSPDDPTPNQDNYFVVHVDGIALYGVCDGHGPFGHLVSFRLVQSLPHCIASSPHFKKDWQQCLREAFHAAQQDLLQFATKHDINIEASGSACSVVAVEKQKAYVASIGDATAMIASWNRHKQRLVFHTVDHKPGLPEEKARLEAAGNDVREVDAGTYRVYLKGSTFPGLTMSRAFGDTACAGVLQEPSYSEVELESGDEFYLLAASDGIWEFIEPDKVVELVTKKLRLKGPRETVRYLVDCSRKRWAHCCGDYCDDITALLVQWSVPDKGVDTNHMLTLSRHV